MRKPCIRHSLTETLIQVEKINRLGQFRRKVLDDFFDSADSANFVAGFGL